MARTTERPRESSPSTAENMDPVLVKLAETATFDCDWPTLRHHMYLALLATVPLFAEKGPPVTYSGHIMIQPAPSPTTTGPEGGQGMGWMEREGGVLCLPGSRDDNPELRPSTQGGLIIPPFPPLDPERRRRPHPSQQLNGAPPTEQEANPFEQGWIDEIIIGGRKLPGWLDEEEAKREVDKMARKLEDLTFAPFTVQRLAELLIAPTKLHSTLGKFLRAVDKMLNVTTPYAPPSYTYVPPPPLLMEVDLGGSPGPDETPFPRTDINSTVPPGSMTPLFSPIPFLASGEADALGEPMMDGMEGGSTEEGLMSPLMLESGGVFASQQGGRRSPTPEPEESEDTEMAEPERDGEGEREGETSGEATSTRPAESQEATANGAHASSAASDDRDRSHQSYLGRVDELDAGPIETGATAAANGHSSEDRDRENIASGVGERGDMTPHGMSDRPVPISSTTVISESEREIAPLPRISSRADVSTAVSEDCAGVEGEAGAAKEAEAKEEAAAPTTSGEATSGEGEGKEKETETDKEAKTEAADEGDAAKRAAEGAAASAGEEGAEQAESKTDESAADNAAPVPVSEKAETETGGKVDEPAGEKKDD